MAIIKVCGITSIDGAETAIQSGASAIGLNSVRHISLHDADKVVEYVRVHYPGAEVWGVFTMHRIEEILQIVNKLGLDGVQFHSSFCQELLANLYLRKRPLLERNEYHLSWPSSCRRILVIGVNDDGSLIHLINNEELRHALKLTEGHNQDFVLFDGKVAGAGKRFTTTEVEKYVKSLPCRFLISGGLTPDNVSEVISIFSGFQNFCGVDVSSGVEDPPKSGMKSSEKIKQFIANAVEALKVKEVALDNK